MGKPISAEITAIPDTISWALNQDVKLFRLAVLSASDRGLIAVGSGGSFSAAAYIAQLHEASFKKVSRPSTPLEYVAHQNDLPHCATVLVSAEGKNKDILAAAETMSLVDSRGLAFSLAAANPLVDFCHQTGSATNICFDAPWGKDGYLATNSLIAMMVLAARAYTNGRIDSLISAVTANWLHSRRKELRSNSIWRELTPDRQLLVLHGSVGKIAAIDFESKFSEGALGPCQIVDYRQFAHGRHLQMTAPQKLFVIGISSDHDTALVEQTLALMPQDVPVFRLALDSTSIASEIFGVLDTLLIVEIVGAERSIDVGQPFVPQFGRDMYAIDLRTAYPEPRSTLPLAVARKIGAGNFSTEDVTAWETAATDFCDRLAGARFKAVVCDFDGTCCDTDKRFDGLDARLVPEFERLADSGIVIGFATGRGNSLHDQLRAKLVERHWSKIVTGYYSGSVIDLLTAPSQEPVADQDLVLLSKWLGEQGLLKQIDAVPKLDGGQMSLRMKNLTAKARVIAAIQFRIREKAHLGWRVYCSGHSIDVLTEKIGKRLVVESVSMYAKADPSTEILRIGDSGDFDGNDFELLNTGIGLSVASVSPDLATCWNMLPKHVRGAAGTLHYLAALELEGDRLRFSDQFIGSARLLCTSNGGRN